MKLGIVVVYLVKEENEKLLDLHLNQIEKHTTVPYTIYGSANRLVSKFRQKLMQHPKVRISECEDTELRDSLEHAFYLEQLVKRAVEDGATHIVILHVDSFPIRSDWVETLTNTLSESCVLSAIMRDEIHDRKPLTTCIFFHRDFYLTYHPTFHLSDTERSSPAYKRYLEEFGPIYDSGIGYGFRIYREGLSWHPLHRSNKGEDHHSLGSIYGDLIFHFGSANRDIKCFPGDDAQPYNISIVRNTLITLRKFGASLLPDKLRQKVNRVVPQFILDFLFPQYRVNEEAFRAVREHLLNDPDSYIHFLRTGQRG